MRVSEKKVNKSLKKQIEKIFVQTIVDIKDEKEAEAFVNDFFSSIETETLTKRLAVAYWLKKGRSYENIRENLKVSSATIASVQSIVDKEGVSNAIKKIEAEEWANLWAKKIKKIVGK